MIGQPDPTLVVGLRKLGFTAVATDDHVVVWSRELLPASPPIAAKPAAPTPEPAAAGLLMTIADAATALGVGRSTLYEMIGQRQLEVVHIGRSARVPTDAVHQLVERLRDANRRAIAS